MRLGKALRPRALRGFRRPRLWLGLWIAGWVLALRAPLEHWRGRDAGDVTRFIHLLGEDRAGGWFRRHGCGAAIERGHATHAASPWTPGWLDNMDSSIRLGLPCRFSCMEGRP